MTKNFSNRLNEIRTDPVSRRAEAILGQLCRSFELDQHTVEHSIRVGVSTLALAIGQAAEKWHVPLYAGGIAHDIGKMYCRWAITSPEQKHVLSPEDRHRIYMHPSRGHHHMTVNNSHPPGHRASWRRASGLVLFSHSAHADPANNYPDQSVIGAYELTRELEPETSATLRSMVVPMAYADGIDALTHKDERPYMDDRLEVVDGVSRDAKVTISLAYELMARSLLPTSIDVVGVFEEHNAVIELEALRIFEDISARVQ